MIKRGGENISVIIRSTDFPGNPKSAVARQLGQFMANGGRTVVVEDADWRTVMALASFRQVRGSAPSFTTWLQRTRPLTTLASMRVILDLDRLISLKPNTTPAGADRLNTAQCLIDS